MVTLAPSRRAGSKAWPPLSARPPRSAPSQFRWAGHRITPERQTGAGHARRALPVGETTEITPENVKGLAPG